MKKFALFALLFVVLFIVGSIIVTFSLGKDYHFEKSIIIKAPTEKVYSHISSLKAFNEWNPWMKLDPNLKAEYTGTSGTVGDKYCWQGNEDVGKGCQEITNLVPNQKQSAKMTFYEPFESTATADIILTPEGSNTKVTWTMDTSFDYPKNLMKFFMNSQMDQSYGEGLNALKTICEKP